MQQYNSNFALCNLMTSASVIVNDASIFRILSLNCEILVSNHVVCIALLPERMTQPDCCCHKNARVG